MRKRFFGVTIFFGLLTCLMVCGSWGTATAQTKVKKDTTIILINNVTMQIEISQALSDLYNFKFEKAEQQFRWFKQKYTWHPLPYFLLGLSEWWKIMPNTKETKYDDRFLAYMDSTIVVAKNLFEEYPEYKIEGAFFLAAAHGFKGRLYSDEERKNWTKSAVEGKAALNYMEVCREKADLSPELLFGDALYNYFSVWVPENYPSLKPIMWFFRKGDKQLGLKQLKEVSYNAFYTRTEAMVWLMRILNSYENDQPRAMQISEYLYTTYPDNPYFHRYYARMLYARGVFPEMERESKMILQRIDSGQVGYEATSGRYAAFFLGQFYESQRKLEEAKKYYLLAVKYAEEIGATESGYYLFSLIALGEINDKLGNKAEAKRYFKEVKKKSNRKDEAFKDAKKRLKKLEKGD
jgi:tetratricopeptide (TPR) repeat protein